MVVSSFFRRFAPNPGTQAATLKRRRTKSVRNLGAAAIKRENDYQKTFHEVPSRTKGEQHWVQNEMAHRLTTVSGTTHLAEPGEVAEEGEECKPSALTAAI